MQYKIRFALAVTSGTSKYFSYSLTIPSYFIQNNPEILENAYVPKYVEGNIIFEKQQRQEVSM